MRTLPANRLLIVSILDSVAVQSRCQASRSSLAYLPTIKLCESGVEGEQYASDGKLAIAMHFQPLS